MGVVKFYTRQLQGLIDSYGEEGIATNLSLHAAKMCFKNSNIEKKIFF